jgi:hypothetical protein
MQFVSFSLFTLAATGFVSAIAIYIRNARYANSDYMGASIIFARMWMTAASCLAIGFGLQPGWHWSAGVLAVLAGYIAILPIKALIAKLLGPFGWGLTLHPDDKRPAGFARYAQIEAALVSELDSTHAPSHRTSL